MFSCIDVNFWCFIKIIINWYASPFSGNLRQKYVQQIHHQHPLGTTFTYSVNIFTKWVHYQGDLTLSHITMNKSCIKKSNNLTVEEVDKITWHSEVYTQWGQFWCHLWWSSIILKILIKCFWPILMTFICDIKINIIMCEPHCVTLLFFVKVQLFFNI